MGSNRACIVNVRDLKVGDHIVDEVGMKVCPPLVTTPADGRIMDEDGNVYEFETLTLVVIR